MLIGLLLFIFVCGLAGGVGLYKYTEYSEKKQHQRVKAIESGSIL
jgi:Fe-S oxidoreductase